MGEKKRHYKNVGCTRKVHWCSNVSLEGTLFCIFQPHKYLLFQFVAQFLILICLFPLRPPNNFFKLFYSVCHISKNEMLHYFKIQDKSSAFWLIQFLFSKVVMGSNFLFSRNKLIDFHEFPPYKGWIKSEVTKLYLQAVFSTYLFL